MVPGGQGPLLNDEKYPRKLNESIDGLKRSLQALESRVAILEGRTPDPSPGQLVEPVIKTQSVEKFGEQIEPVFAIFQVPQSAQLPRPHPHAHGGQPKPGQAEEITEGEQGGSHRDQQKTENRTGR